MCKAAFAKTAIFAQGGELMGGVAKRAFIRLILADSAKPVRQAINIAEATHSSYPHIWPSAR
jgi:hypothetical protein